ncbi:zinc finger protein 142 [Drosophila willistoni]|uniref:zinc finger protein 142 n=1 Tax=Drosophila willistoni TaxID=7260 RepID=UPI00017D7517|nr:zinc finger protein 142 [Drosophila willistoni]
MELPSMVERTGGQLVVRSLVSGAAVYQTPVEASEANVNRQANLLMGVEQMERQLEHYSMTSRLVEAMPVVQMNRENVTDGPSTANSESTAVNEDDLPQCKIRRNYSCNQCAFFTQNPRSHLSHLRDVHGERIVINECKLCLYASRHFQKLVRHMKMVHGCSDDVGAVGPGGIAGVPMRGKRNISRELRKRRLEESIEIPSSVNPSINSGLLRMLQNGPSLEQLKCELQQQEQQLRCNMEAYNRQQELYQLQDIVSNNNNIFSMAFEFQCRMMPTPMPAAQSSIQAACKLEPENSSSEDSEEANSGSPTPNGRNSNAFQYQCHKCSYNTPIRARFKKHVKYHSMPLIKCNSCDFHTPYKWNLDRHTKNHGAQGIFKCAVCDFSSDIKQSLTIHEQNHHIPTVSQLKAVRRPNLEENEGKPSISKKLDFDGEPGQTNIITCSHCQQKVLNAGDLIKHLQVCASISRNTNQQLPQGNESEQTEEELPQVASDLSYCGVETAPGYGEIIDHLSLEEVSDFTPWKKVFKCPHCTFWAATASRFHVHIVGHLNRKPFECSLCSYRSNWRWDITKHIRLKAMRDKSHNQAQVLMNDETGRRNYAKYNQYLTLMKVNADQLVANQDSVKGLTRVSDKLEQLYEPMEQDDNSDIMEPPLDLSKPKIETVNNNAKVGVPTFSGHKASLVLPSPPKRMKYNESNSDEEVPLDLSKSTSN